MKERRPVDIIAKIDNRRRNRARANEIRLWRLVIAPTNRGPVRTGLLERDQFHLPSFRAVRFAQRFVFGAGCGVERRFLFPVQQRTDDADRARRVQNVDSAFVIMRRNLNRCVRAAGRGTANEQRQLEIFALHFLRDVHHFVE